jgi:phosphoribosylformimino-5-aminoimidazole carboxamide ribotide isomerase
MATMTFIIYPAIDLRRGQVVRLRQGDPDAQTTFADNPAAVARCWAEQGAEWLHVVNLDGAFTGRDQNLDLNLDLNLRRLVEIRAATSLPIQFGGGLRTLGDVALALELGATRVVLGTVAVRQPQIVADAVARFGAERIAVGIDARDGMVATHGWQETSALDTLTVAQDEGPRRAARRLHRYRPRWHIDRSQLGRDRRPGTRQRSRGHRQRRRRLVGRHPRPIRPSSRRH